MINLHSKLAVASVMASFAASSASADTIKTKIPAEHVRSFQQMCEADGLTNATCWCMVEKLNATRNGAFLLDMAGAKLEKMNETQSKVAVLKLANRHNFRRSEALAAVGQSKTIMADVAKQCE